MRLVTQFFFSIFLTATRLNVYAVVGFGLRSSLFLLWTMWLWIAQLTQYYDFIYYFGSSKFSIVHAYITSCAILASMICLAVNLRVILSAGTNFEQLSQWIGLQRPAWFLQRPWFLLLNVIPNRIINIK